LSLIQMWFLKSRDEGTMPAAGELPQNG